jgi:hypothetical protein
MLILWTFDSIISLTCICRFSFTILLKGKGIYTWHLGITYQLHLLNKQDFLKCNCVQNSPIDFHLLPMFVNSIMHRLMFSFLVIASFLPAFTCLSREKVLISYMVWLANSGIHPKTFIYLPQWYSVNDTETEGKPFCREVLKRHLRLHSGSSTNVLHWIPFF